MRECNIEKRLVNYSFMTTTKDYILHTFIWQALMFTILQDIFNPASDRQFALGGGALGILTTVGSVS